MAHKRQRKNWHFVPLSEIGNWPRTDSHQHRFVHVTNPFIPAGYSGIDSVQKLTIEGLKEAQLSTQQNVELVFAVSATDRQLEFEEGITLPCIERFVSDVHRFNNNKALPMLFDVLSATDRLGLEGDDFLIYTNMDIIPLPYFYDAIAEISARGIDAFTINRRTISESWRSSESPYLGLFEVGRSHPGTDCLVFKAKYLQHSIKSMACLGAEHVMKSLLYNLTAHSPRLVIVQDAHLTCHIGDEKNWKTQEFNEYTEHNRKAATHVAQELCERDETYRGKLLHFAIEWNDWLLLNVVAPSWGRGRIHALYHLSMKYLKEWLARVGWK